MTTTHIRQTLLSLLLLLPLHNCPAEIVSGQNWLDLTAGWEFVAGKGAAGSLAVLDEEKQLVLAYDFENGGDFVAASRSLDDLDPIESLTGVQILAKGPAGPVAVELVDSTDQVFTYHMGKADSDDQKSFELKADKPDPAPGGAGDKAIHYPLKTIRLIVEKGESLLKGTITFERVALHAPQYQKQ